MKQPTIGMIVIYKPNSFEDMRHIDPKPYPAMITEVINQTTVNLQIFPNADSLPFFKSGIIQGSMAGNWDFIIKHDGKL